LEELADILGKSQSTAQKILDNLSFEYNKREGALEVVALPKDRYVMQLKPELTPRVGKLIPGGLLSFATLQTLVSSLLNSQSSSPNLLLKGGHTPMTISETSLTRSSLMLFQKVDLSF
jgi:hypothetical protein